MTVPTNVAPRPKRRPRVFSRASADVREDVCGPGRCDLCGKQREIVARRGMQFCRFCHATRRVVEGRYVWGSHDQPNPPTSSQE